MLLGVVLGCKLILLMLPPLRKIRLQVLIRGMGHYLAYIDQIHLS